MRITAEMIKAFNDDDDDRLRSLLRLKPWEESPLDAVGECPYPPTTMGALSWPKAKALRKQLEDCVRFTSKADICD